MAHFFSACSDIHEEIFGGQWHWPGHVDRVNVPRARPDIVTRVTASACKSENAKVRDAEPDQSIPFSFIQSSLKTLLR